MRIVKSALTYWALIFALGFVLGTVRVLWGAEALGERNFLLLEIPVMLAASWLAARWLIARFTIAQAGAAFVMGLLAFLLLMAAEVTLASTLGEGAAQWIAGLLKPPGLYGFAAQVAFALMPRLALHQAHRSHATDRAALP